MQFLHYANIRQNPVLIMIMYMDGIHSCILAHRIHYISWLLDARIISLFPTQNERISLKKCFHSQTITIHKYLGKLTFANTVSRCIQMLIGTKPRKLVSLLLWNERHALNSSQVQICLQ